MIARTGKISDNLSRRDEFSLIARRLDFIPKGS